MSNTVHSACRDAVTRTGEDIVKAELSLYAGYDDGHGGIKPKEESNKLYMEGWNKGREAWQQLHLNPEKAQS